MKKIWHLYKDSSFLLKMTLGFLLGIGAGILFGPSMEAVKPLGTILINLLNLIAVPVIFLTVVLAINQMNPRYLGRIGGKLLVYYGITTAAAVLIGVALALWINPGAGLELPNADVEKPETPGFSDVLLNIVPDNLFTAFSSGELMGILFLAVITGLALVKMRYSDKDELKKSGETLHQFFSAANDLFFLLLQGILLYAPVGIFAIGASTFGSQGWETFRSLFAFTGVFYLGVLLLWLLVYTSFLKLAKWHVRDFFASTKDAYVTAFFTSSSIASLPVAMESAKKAGISDRIVNFSLPIGAVFNSDGGALRMGVSIVFAANVTGLDLTVMDFITIVVIGTLLSIGTAGIPAAGLVTLAAVLTMFNLPLEIVALIAGVDVLIGMAGTASNVFGDMVGSAFVDKKETDRTNPES
ncbi:dicarboxylate/amino acid:cation symporter [Bacillus sp. SB49]|uniref:dicarboxylate/amino acid:cation symporter n=1 Tax=Bacillus sp. SB49 TaxID=1071080 RepID=UPI000407E750|nr:dicarboxylate/amino acid:cation symporter [Bacillus sp. SB49]QHT46264.1 dicarboxylate/amino acid:cation symporter [Bacillus sp. SB49]